MSRAELRVLVTGSRPGMVEALAGLIGLSDDMTVSTASFDELGTPDREDPSVAVIVEDGDPAGVARAADLLRRQVPGLPLIALRRAGAWEGSLPSTVAATACLTADANLADLEAAIRTVRRGPGRRGAGTAPTPAAPDSSSLHHLTSRERQVLAAVVTGARNASIATELGVSSHTVRTHLRHILLKLGVDNRVDAAMRARACGLVARDASG